MKRKLLCVAFIALFLLSSLSSPSAHASGNDDKSLHVTASAGITLATYIALRSSDLSKGEAIMASIALTMFIGTLKEVKDNPIDMQDVNANAQGSVGMGFLIFTFDWF